MSSFGLADEERKEMCKVLATISAMQSIGFDFEFSARIFSGSEREILFFAENSHPER